MKYKIGDRVRVRSDLSVGTVYGNQKFIDSMEKEMGKTVTICGVSLCGHYNIQEDVYNWTDEMFEPAVEMSAEEAVRLIGNMCIENLCASCPVYKIDESEPCNVIRSKYPEIVVEVLKKWKVDHEKKSIETEFRWVIRVIEDTGTAKRCVHEERLPKDTVDLAKPQSEILKKYCAEHKGKFFTTREKICVTKE